MIIKIKHNLISNTFYVYRSASLTKRGSVELRKRRTKAMLAFMKQAKIKVEENFVTYT